MLKNAASRGLRSSPHSVCTVFWLHSAALWPAVCAVDCALHCALKASWGVAFRTAPRSRPLAPSAPWSAPCAEPPLHSPETAAARQPAGDAGGSAPTALAARPEGPAQVGARTNQQHQHRLRSRHRCRRSTRHHPHRRLTRALTRRIPPPRAALLPGARCCLGRRSGAGCPALARARAPSRRATPPPCQGRPHKAAACPATRVRRLPAMTELAAVVWPCRARGPRCWSARTEPQHSTSRASGRALPCCGAHAAPSRPAGPGAARSPSPGGSSGSPRAEGCRRGRVHAVPLPALAPTAAPAHQRSQAPAISPTGHPGCCP
mmetsp:Transcript_101717/g.328222  ORF Transcript_101717/g.328222 Transcript_101717/m.328222 type:complete len:319 (-) Transcript_101717:1007-1963(-)